jgi:hypothetical protein
MAREQDAIGCNMKAKELRKLAADPRFIPGIYNYCDRWCERCPLSERCLNRAMELAEDDGDPATHDLSNQKFWDKLHQKFQDTLEMVREDAQARGIDLGEPKLEAELKVQERAERRLAVKNRPLTWAAMAYVKATDKWFESARPTFAAKGTELETLARLGAGSSRAEAAELMEFVDVIRWYQHFIYVKLCRAIESRASEDFETDEELKSFPKDSDGSAKIALIAMDRSLSAWARLRETLGDNPDSILDLLAQLAAIRRETEKLFPEARAFVRPGFDGKTE